MAAFDYDGEAEPFPSRGMRGRPVGYRRFARAADAIRFAIEELPAQALAGAWLEVSEERYDAAGISSLYERADYPPWIARADPLWPIVNREEIARRESRRRPSPNSPYRHRVLVASPAPRPVRGARPVEGSNGRSREHARALAASCYSPCVGVLLGLGSGGSGRYRPPDLRSWRKWGS